MLTIRRDPEGRPIIHQNRVGKLFADHVWGRGNLERKSRFAWRITNRLDAIGDRHPRLEIVCELIVATIGTGDWFEAYE